MSSIVLILILVAMPLLTTCDEGTTIPKAELPDSWILVLTSTSPEMMDIKENANRRISTAAGFDEGDKPDNWVCSLQSRGIVVQCSVLQAEAAVVLADYAASEGPTYNVALDSEQDNT